MDMEMLWEAIRDWAAAKVACKGPDDELGLTILSRRTETVEATVEQMINDVAGCGPVKIR